MQIEDIKVTDFPGDATYFHAHIGNRGLHGKRIRRADGDWYIAGVKLPVYTVEEKWEDAWCVAIYTPEQWTIEIERGVISNGNVRNCIIPRWIKYLTTDFNNNESVDVIKYGLEQEIKFYQTHNKPERVGEKLWSN
jgi:hypothetical protein